MASPSHRGNGIADPYRPLGLVLVAACLCIAAATGAPARAQTGDWTNHNGTLNEQNHSPLAQINTGTIARLGLAWRLDLPDETMLEATPIAVGGTLFFTGGRSKLYAVDGASGRLLWTYDPEVWKHNPQKMRYTLPVNRGPAYAAGRIFFATLDGRLIALDAKSGKLVWSVVTVPPSEFQTITGAPRVFKDKVVIGQGGADRGSRGFVTAYDQKTGRQVWRFYMVPGTPEENRGDPIMEMAAATWLGGDFAKAGTGGGAWDSFTYDEEFNRIYIGGGNNGKLDPFDRVKLTGDRLFSGSIVALDADTGKYAWHYQLKPDEMWDYNCAQQMILADLAIDGVRRKVLMQAPKNGFFFVIDRATGKLISAEKFGKVTWAHGYDLATGRPIEDERARLTKGPFDIWPAPLGAHGWQSMAFNPATGLVYIPTMQAGLKGGGHLEVTEEEGDGKGALIAWDPVRQKAVWTVRHDTYWNGGVLSTAGGLVLQGTADGMFAAYDAASGARLWRFDAKLGIIAPPMSYAVRGRQYISVLVGYASSNAIGSFSDMGWKYGVHTRRQLTFALDGRDRLPDGPGPDKSLNPLDDPDLRIDPADLAPGQIKYILNCVACHGANAHAAGVAPDLRESQAALKLDSFLAVVRDGALLQRGMPRYENLSAEELRQIHAFIRMNARKALGTWQGSSTAH